MAHTRRLLASLAILVGLLPKAAESQEQGPKAPAKEKPAEKPPAPAPQGKKPAEKQPDAPKPAEKQPDAPKPDAKPAEPPLLPPDAPKPDAPKPEEKQPEEKQPEEKQPDAPKPDAPTGAAKPEEATAGEGAAQTTIAPPPPADAKPKRQGDGTETDTNVFAEDWWTSARPVFEIHGYMRVRSEFMSHFALGRKDALRDALWPQPADNDYVDTGGERRRVQLCGDDPQNPEPCENNVQAGANMRFRINPELHISDNVRVMAQLDLLDNLVLGSTPEGYANQPGADGGYDVRQRGGYTPIGAFTTTQWAPSAGQNSLQDSIVVKRVWGEYMTPFGQLRFGRMPSHWGLGMLANAGDGYDSDWQSTSDRLMFVTGIPDWDLYFAGIWDFANEGATSALINERQGQPYDLAQSDDVDQWGFVIARRRKPELQRLELARGLPVFNGGMYAVYRQQNLDDNSPLGATPIQVAEDFQFRGAQAFIPDFWFQFLFGKFRFEAEAAVIWGSIDNTDIRGGNNNNNPDDPSGDEDGWNIQQMGITFQSEFRAFEDKLRVMLGGGYATGDSDVEGLAPPAEGFDVQLTRDRTFSTFRFHPDYRVDLILFRNILQRVQGAYYLRPSVEYDFTRDLDGQRIGGGATLIWSRASEPVQTPGNSADLGLEINLKLYYQAKDGALNDDLDKLGGFYTQLEYGVMFPLGGLGYLPGEEQDLEDAGNPVDMSTAQMLRWYLGILY
jgi:uncharacterized protein (TIGR04551 family)